METRPWHDNVRQWHQHVKQHVKHRVQIFKANNATRIPTDLCFLNQLRWFGKSPISGIGVHVDVKPQQFRRGLGEHKQSPVGVTGHTVGLAIGVPIALGVLEKVKENLCGTRVMCQAVSAWYAEPTRSRSLSSL